MTRSINQQVQKAEGSVIMLSLAEKRGKRGTAGKRCSRADAHWKASAQMAGEKV
jgi:hypothetical protein